MLRNHFDEDATHFGLLEGIEDAMFPNGYPYRDWEE
jgi:hypothetical protein